MNPRQKSTPKHSVLTKDTILHVAHLARVELSPAELKTLPEQLQDILDFIDKLKEIDIKGISPTSHILPINNVLREDKQSVSLSIDKALENAPHRQEDFFGVPQVIE